MWPEHICKRDNFKFDLQSVDRLCLIKKLNETISTPFKQSTALSYATQPTTNVSKMERKD